MASALRQRKPHDKNIRNISEDDEFGKKTTYEPSIIVRAEERVKVGLPMSCRRTRDTNELQSWRSLITGKRAALIVGILSKSSSCLATRSKLSS